MGRVEAMEPTLAHLQRLHETLDRFRRPLCLRLDHRLHIRPLLLLHLFVLCPLQIARRTPAAIFRLALDEPRSRLSTRIGVVRARGWWFQLPAVEVFAFDERLVGGRDRVVGAARVQELLDRMDPPAGRQGVNATRLAIVEFEMLGQVCKEL